MIRLRTVHARLGVTRGALDPPQPGHHNVVTFSPETLIEYLVTQTNVIAAVEGGREHLADVRQWLMHSITPLFEDREEAHFLFQGSIWYLQKANV